MRSFVIPRVGNGNDLFTAGDLQVSSRNNAIDAIQVNSYLLGLRKLRLIYFPVPAIFGAGI